MADLVAILALGLQYAVIILITQLSFRGLLSLWLDAAVFLMLATAGIIVWHKEKYSNNPKEWRKLGVSSVILGFLFFAWDVVLAYLRGYANPFHFPGGLLGLPLTLAVCPGLTMICVAGLARALYLKKICAAPK
jgi:hypothetical protein